jgi:hypothetical protein
MDKTDAKAPRLPQPKFLTDKFNRVIKTEEDFRIGMRRGADGVSRWYRNGKLVREETPKPKSKEDIVVVFRQEAIDTTTRKVFKSPTPSTTSTGPTLGGLKR